MLDSEEQVQQCLPIPLPKAKFGSPGDSDEETDEDAPAAMLGYGHNIQSDWNINAAEFKNFIP